MSKGRICALLQDDISEFMRIGCIVGTFGEEPYLLINIRRTDGTSNYRI